MRDPLKLKIAQLYAQLQLEFPSNGIFFSALAENFLPMATVYKRKSKLLETIQYDIEYLIVDLSLTMNDIQNAFDKYKIILLRKINPSFDTLIIGCGSYPLSDSSGNKLNLKDFEASEFRSEHSHLQAITIDPCMSKNPTIVGMFGWHQMAELFEGKQFSKIVLEGVNLFDDPNLTNIISDLGALLSPTGLIINTGLEGISLCYTLEAFKAACYCQDKNQRFSLAEVVGEYFEHVDTSEVHKHIDTQRFKLKD